MRLEHLFINDAFVIYDAPMPTGRGVLDPITVFLRDFGGSGQIVVECYGSAWSQWFGAIGGGTTLREFLASCHPEYLATKLLTTTSQPFNKTTTLWVNRIAHAVIEAIKVPT
jgi:hypothetical protein